MLGSLRVVDDVCARVVSEVPSVNPAIIAMMVVVFVIDLLVKAV
jgi:hypothetical protein